MATMAICNRESNPGEEGGGVEEDRDGGGGEAMVYKKGAWSKEEDEKLRKAVEEQGTKNWVIIERISGLGRPAKNCRLRWLNYLRPNLKKCPFTEEEEKLIVDLHKKFGNSWARIANKLAGRSDNEIKNFWHKRAKKCKREKLPIYPSQENHHTNDDEVNANHHNHTPSQFQPSTPNIVTIASDASSIHSPQSIISTPQPQFLSSPTTPLLNATTSLAHLSSSSPSSHRPTEIILSIPNHLQSPVGGGAAAFTSLRKPPPVLSASPLRRFLRAKSQFPPHLDSSTLMESPRSPLNLKLSPRQLNSPTGAPLSPPVPSETCFQSNVSISDAKTAQEMTVDTDLDVHLHSSADVKEEPPSIQFSPPENSQVETDSNLEIMEELRKAQARVRFLKNKLKRSSRKQRLHSECPETADLSRGEAPLDESSSQSTIKDCALSRTSSRLEDLAGGNAPPKTPKKKDVRRKGDAIGTSNPEGLQVKKARKGKTTESESSGSKISSEKSLAKEEDSPSEILERIHSEDLQEQKSSDFLDHLNSQYVVSDPSTQGFLSESSSLLQEGFFKGDLYGQTSLIENPFSSQRRAPFIDAHAATTPGNEHGQLISYLQPDELGLSFMDGCGSDLLMHQNTTSVDLLDFDFLRCEHFSLQNSVGCSSASQPSFMQLNSSYQTCKQLMEQESETAKIDEFGFVQHQIPETSLFDSRYMMSFEHEMECLLGDNLWSQGQTQMEACNQTFPVNRVDSVTNPMEFMMNSNNESTSGYTGGFL